MKKTRIIACNMNGRSWLMTSSGSDRDWDGDRPMNSQAAKT
jgi:hypothetical protein